MEVLTNPQDYTLNEHVTVMGYSGHLDTSKVLSEKTLEHQKLALQFLDKSKLFPGDNKIQTLLEEGVCAETILKTANKISADVIVVGSHSRNLKVTYAGLEIRSLATFIDLIIISVVLLIHEIFLFSFNFNKLHLNSYRFFMVIGIWIFYHTTFESSGYQATPGKMRLKLKVIDLYGKNLSVVRAMFKSLAVSISIMPFGLGIWYISTGPRKRGWHDLIAGSYVIKS